MRASAAAHAHCLVFALSPDIRNRFSIILTDSDAILLVRWRRSYRELWNFQEFQGTKVPGSESSIYFILFIKFYLFSHVLSLLRAKVRGNESSSYPYGLTARPCKSVYKATEIGLDWTKTIWTALTYFRKRCNPRDQGLCLEAPREQKKNKVLMTKVLKILRLFASNYYWITSTAVD